MPLQKSCSKSDLRTRKRDASPFLDAALEFLFAIVEREIQKKEPAYMAPNIHEFYSFSLCIQMDKTRRNRNKPTISPALLKVFRFTLGTKLTHIKHAKGQFTVCLQIVTLALLAYSEFLHCMDSEIKTADSSYAALSWYYSHYFRPVHREIFLTILKHHIFEKRAFLHLPCLSRVIPYLQGMQNYFQSSEFQEYILSALFQCL